MTIEQVYRVLCGNTKICIMSSQPRKKLYEGMADYIPVWLLDAEIYQVTACNSTIVIDARVDGSERRRQGS